MKIKEFESSLLDLKSFAESKYLCEARSGKSINVYWTKIDFLGCYLVNILAPFSSIFWSFGYFSKISGSIGDLGSQIIHGESNHCFEEAEKEINNVLKSLSINKTSVFTNTVFLGLCRYYGYTYADPNKMEFSDELGSLEGRFFSNLVKKEDKESFSEYLENQIDQFEGSCIKQLEEGCSISMSGYANRTYSTFLNKMFMQMTLKEIDAAESYINNYKKSGADWAKEFDITDHYSYENMGFTPIKLNSSEGVESYRVIARFRVEFAIDTLSLINLQRVRDTLAQDTGLWNDAYKVINVDLIKLIDTKLDKYPVISTNPF